MALIERGVAGSKQATKTIAFDGSAGNGAQGTITVLTLTGRVWLLGLAVFCTEDLVGATGTVELGTSSDINGLIVQTTATEIDVNDWWKDATPAPGIVQKDALQIDVLLSEDVIITVATADVTNGTLVVDAFYFPVTSDGALS